MIVSEIGKSTWESRADYIKHLATSKNITDNGARSELTKLYLDAGEVSGEINGPGMYVRYRGNSQTNVEFKFVRF